MSISMRVGQLVERLWYDEGVVARLGRALLVPVERTYAGIVSRRNAAFDAQPTRRGALAALSVGNVTVGGTGKTPVAAWCAGRLRALGGRPAIVLRGYGDDEWRVHALLNPGASVIVTPDRNAGLVIARTRGNDCVVLDDAFQHRRAPRVADIVLVSADRWALTARLLPAGPYREPLTSLRRADVIAITIKAADQARVELVIRAVTDAAPRVPLAIFRLRPDTLRLAVALPRDGTAPGLNEDRTGLLSHPARWLDGRPVIVASAIGDPRAFEAQLRAAGAVIRRVYRFPDHHTFRSRDAIAIAGGGDGATDVVCTLKDAVKLAPLWPREAATLWYLSQTVLVERGADVLDRVFARVLAARH